MSELFELSLLGGSVERRDRRLRPDVTRIGSSSSPRRRFALDDLWALPLLDEPTRVRLRERAAAAVQGLRDRRIGDDGDAETFGWMTAATCRREAPRIIDERIVAPLRGLY